MAPIALRTAFPDDAALPDYQTFDETESILLALAQAVEQRDHCTAGHCERLALISVTLGAAMKLPREQMLALYRGGYLHDIGKVGIPDSILFKPGPLTPEEWKIMRGHTVRGEEICRPSKSMEAVLPIIRSHHERWDGSGYPDGLRGEEIPLLARVLQVADIYDALTSMRPYKAPIDPALALVLLQTEADRGWRDPEITDIFIRLHRNVISRINAYNLDADRTLDHMRESMRNLHRALRTEMSALFPVNPQ